MADPENNAIRDRLASLDASPLPYEKTHQVGILTRCAAEQAWMLARRLD